VAATIAGSAVDSISGCRRSASKVLEWSALVGASNNRIIETTIGIMSTEGYEMALENEQVRK